MGPSRRRLWRQRPPVLPDYRAITPQLSFRGSEWPDSNVPQAVEPELVQDPQDAGDSTRHGTYDFVLERADAAAAA